MNRFQQSMLLTICLLAVGFIACSEETTDPPEAVSAKFSMTTSGLEGDTVVMNNTSTGATTYAWLITPGDVVSTEESPSFFFKEAGNFNIRLIATGEGGSDTTEQALALGVDKEYRIFGSGTKTWYVHHVDVNGTPMGEESCSWDNTLVLNRIDSTFSYNLGANGCASEPFPQQDGTITWDVPSGEMYMHTINPFVTDVTYTLTHLTPDTAIANATLTSGSSAEFTLVSTIRTN